MNGCEGVCENNSAKRSASKLSDIHNGSTGQSSPSVEAGKVQALAQEEISRRKGQDQPATHDDGQLHSKRRQVPYDDDIQACHTRGGDRRGDQPAAQRAIHELSFRGQWHNLLGGACLVRASRDTASAVGAGRHSLGRNEQGGRPQSYESGGSASIVRARRPRLRRMSKGRPVAL